MYRLVNLSKYYNSDNKVNKALDNISLEIKDKEFVMISGPSGSGKSTLLNVLSGIDSYQEGEMYFNDKETSYFDEKDYEEFRYNNIAFVFQEYNLLESYSCYQNIEVALISKNIQYTHEDIVNILRKVHLEDKEKVKAAKLSGGQKARLAIARALAFNAPIFVLDEPTGALDSKSSLEVVNLLKELKGSKTIIVVTHNEELFKDVANHHIKIQDGRVKEDKYVSETIDKEINEKYISKKYNKEAKIAALNIKNQPKKSILSFSLSLVLTIFIFTIISTLSYLAHYEGQPSNLQNSYERIMLHSDDGFSEEDLNIVQKNSYQTILENELLNASIRIDGIDGIYSNLGALNSARLTKNDLMAGKLPTKENEIIIPRNYNIAKNFSRFDGKKVDLYFLNNGPFNSASIHLNVNVVGVSKDNFYYLYDAKNINNILYGYQKYMFGTERFPITSNIYLDYSIDENTIYSDDEYEFYIKDQKVKTDIYTRPLTYKEIVVNPKFLNNIYGDNIFDISVYSKDVKSYVRNIDEKYSYFIPNTPPFQDVDYRVMTTTFTSIFMFGIICLLVVLTNVITKQIYRYKNKDNAILNSLGYSTPTLKKSLALELLINYVLSLLLCFILPILDFTTNCFKGIFTLNNLVTYLLILLVLSITIIMTIKQSFKMFSSNSLFKKLRGGDLDA